MATLLGLRARAALLAATALAALALGAGCDAEPDAPTTPDRSTLLGRSGSELDRTGPPADGGEAADHEEHTAETEVEGSPPGSAPLDPRAEPDPIPWTPRIHDSDA